MKKSRALIGFFVIFGLCGSRQRDEDGKKAPQSLPHAFKKIVGTAQPDPITVINSPESMQQPDVSYSQQGTAHELSGSQALRYIAHGTSQGLNLKTIRTLIDEHEKEQKIFLIVAVLSKETDKTKQLSFYDAPDWVSYEQSFQDQQVTVAQHPVVEVAYFYYDPREQAFYFLEAMPNRTAPAFAALVATTPHQHTSVALTKFLELLSQRGLQTTRKLHGLRTALWCACQEENKNMAAEILRNLVLIAHPDEPRTPRTDYEFAQQEYKFAHEGYGYNQDSLKEISAATLFMMGIIGRENPQFREASDAYYKYFVEITKETTSNWLRAYSLSAQMSLDGKDRVATIMRITEKGENDNVRKGILAQLFDVCRRFFYQEPYNKSLYSFFKIYFNYAQKRHIDEKEFAEALFMLAQLYRYGIGGAPHNDRIVPLLFKNFDKRPVADGFKAAANHILAELYYLGAVGVGQDFAKARTHYEQVLDYTQHTHRDDIYNHCMRKTALARIGELYYFGVGGEKQDFKSAQQYFQEALDTEEKNKSSPCAQANGIALLRLGLIDHYGLGGLPRNVPAAAAQFEKVSENGGWYYVTALVERASIAYEKKDYIEARSLYGQVVGLTDKKIMHDTARAIALYRLGTMAAEGLGGFQKYPEKARSYWQQVLGTNAVVIKKLAQKKLAALDQ